MLFTVVALALMANAAYAIDEVELLAEEMMLSGSSDDSEADATKANTEEDDGEDSGSIFGFIIKPISKFFSSGEDATQTDSTTQESFLDKSIRLAGEGKLEDQMN